MKTLKDRLVAARSGKRLTMSEVSRTSDTIAKKNREPRMKITQGYLSRLESGSETNPSMRKLQTLCIIYKMKPYSMLGLRGVKK